MFGLLFASYNNFYQFLLTLQADKVNKKRALSRY